MKETMTIQEAIKQWNAGSPIFSIDMSGMGPGYEQGIQITVFEMIKLLKFKCPNKAQTHKVLDDALAKVDKKYDIGHSGASAGAAIWLAHKILSTGYAETINTAPKDRLIQVDNNWQHKLRQRKIRCKK